MTALTDRIDFPNSRKVFLVEQTAGEQLNLWTLAAGQTYTYWCATANHVDDVLEDGASLAVQTSIANVESNAGSFYWDQAAGRIYVHGTADALPSGKTIQAVVSFTFSTVGRVYQGRYYDPRIKSFPSLSMRVERMFGDPGQLGSGAMVYANEDGFFDYLSGLQWDAGRIVLKMGCDNPHPPYAQATYSEFDTVGTWIVKEWSKSDTEFTVRFEEIKAALKVKIPIDHYTREEFPYMREEDVGKPKQIAYGQIFDIAPVCVHLGEKRFRVAGHPIQGFFGLRVKSAVSGYWVNADFTTKDNDLAEFTFSPWDMQAEIAVDFFGKMNLDGSLMDNPADVVRDILTSYARITSAELDTELIVIVPSVGGISASGIAPTMAETGFLSITPRVGNFFAIGVVPGIDGPRYASPGSGVMAISGIAPSTNLPRVITPTETQLVVSGKVPQIA